MYCHTIRRSLRTVMNVQPLSTALKCFQLLEAIAVQPGPVRIASLGRQLGESRATTYQRLLTLTAAGWLDRLPDGSYRLSTRACRIGAAALNQVGFGERAQPVLDELAARLGDAISLVMLEGERLVIVQRAEAQAVLRADLRVGSVLSYRDSASGTVWLAFGPADLAARLEEAGVRLPSRSRIAQAAREQFSIGGGGRSLQGIAALAVPVVDVQGRCLASLSVSSPEGRFAPERFLPVLREAAGRLAAL